VNKFHQLLKKALTESIVVLAREVECLSYVGAGECIEESSADLRACKRRSRSEVVCDCEAVIMLGKLCKGKNIENLIREGRDERGFSKVFDCSLLCHVIVRRQPP
jgi:aminopeptidase-like protein